MENVPEPHCGDNEIKVKVTHTAICGTDLHIYNWDLWAQRTLKIPLIIGHEFCGIIEEIGKNIAMQIAAMNPVGLDEADITQDIIDKEIEIGKDLARQEGKPEEMLEKIAMGRLKKFFKENTLINQTYIKDSKKTVMQYLKDASADLSIVSFKRVSLG